MNISELKSFLEGRRSVRKYRPEPVSEYLVDQILKTTKSAPSAGNLESWDAVVIFDEGIRELLSDAAYQQMHLVEAPVIIAVCANYIRAMSRYGERGILYALEDATIASTYMMLGAHAAGLSSCWTGAFDDQMVIEILDLPGHIRPVVLLTLGYGADTTQAPERMDTMEHVHEDNW